ncbi:MAG: SDR family NAD(P)-dependent oxidoreductase [Bacteroidetes bacterium]|nr:SDR family NAD(P)-dependent oxidoreductase [Bacteroidota bacterium]
MINSEICIDVLINNAGVYKVKEQFTSDGIEMNLAVNYLATVRLSNLLLPLLKKAPQGRIINLTSELYKKGNVNKDLFVKAKKYNAGQQYADTKMAIVLYTQKLAEELNGTNVTVNCVHPGVVASDVFRDYSK